MVQVGLVGCGTIGSELARAIQRTYRHAARITALHDIDRSHALRLARRLSPRPPIVSLAQLIRRSDLVLEAASSGIAADVVVRCLRAGRSVFVMSVGGLLSNPAWRRLSRRSRGKLYIPSGALAGLDGVKALAAGRMRWAALTTRKPPRALADAPYVRRKHLDLSRLRRPRVVFEGSPRAAVKAFPQNINVAAALSLVVGDDRAVRIRVVADPAATRNVHEVDAEGEAGRIRCRIESRPSANPKTSEIAIRSAVATLGRIFDSICIGT